MKNPTNVMFVKKKSFNQEIQKIMKKFALLKIGISKQI